MNYIENLVAQLNNSKSPAINLYLEWLYKKIHTLLEKEDLCLEIGAGAGVSKNFLINNQYLATDLICNEGEVIGGINAKSMPFPDYTFTRIFGIDMFHHIDDAKTAISEIFRVSANKAKIIFVEPYISFFSYPIYRLFHPEGSKWPYEFETLQTHVNNEPDSGEQGLLQAYLKTNHIYESASRNGFEIIHIKITKFSFLSFFATGGINNPFKTPRKLIYFFLVLERFIPQTFMRFLASRQLCVITVERPMEIL